MNFKKTVIAFILLLPFLGHAQNDSLSIEEQLAQLELEMDSMAIFSLIDSLLQAEKPRYSELGFRLSYNSDVLSAGRNYGINQHGISPGVTYYHKSGAYADLSGYWNSAFDPKYNLTIASLGYMKLLGNKWMMSASYDRWQYTSQLIASDSTTSSNDLKNSLNLSGSFNTKHLYGSLDYNFLFGANTSAHRIIGTVSGNLSFKRAWIFDRVKIAPSASIIFGNSDVIIQYAEDYVQDFRFGEYLHENIDQEEFRQFLATVELTEAERREINSIENDPRLDRREKRRAKTQIYLDKPEVRSYLAAALQQEAYTTKNQYGIMNYSFSLPVLLSKKNFTFILSYTYSIPVNLPGEDYDLDPIGYFGVSLSYRLPLR